MVRVEGPLEEIDLSTVEVLQTRAGALEEGRQRLMGDRVSGREPVPRTTANVPLYLQPRDGAGAPSTGLIGLALTGASDPHAYSFRPDHQLRPP